MMRVTIDWRMCVGSGLCVAAAPGGFELVPHAGGRRAVLAGCPSDSALRAAAGACPMLAIRLLDDHGHVVFPPPPADDVGS